MKAGQLVLMVASAVVGGLAGYGLHRGERVRVETHDAHVVPVAVASRPGPCGPSAAELRAMIHDELAQRPAAPAAELTATNPQAELSPESLAAVTQAEQRLDDAEARGLWSAADGGALRQLLVEMPNAHRGRLMARLAQSVNEGVLHLEPGINPL